MTSGRLTRNLLQVLFRDDRVPAALLPLAPAATGLARAADRIAAAMRTYGADEVMIAAEVEQMVTRRIGPTVNRSVVGIMTEFTFLADHWRGPDLDELSARLAATPCSPLYRTHVTPESAFRHATAR